MTVTTSGPHSIRATLMAGLLAIGTCLAGAADSRTARAQGYPSRPVQVVVTFAAGGGVDLTTRLVAEVAGEILGQRLVIENRGGGATVVGSAGVARAEPDGYTLLAAPTTMVINPALKVKLPFDWERDFVPVVLVAKLPFVVVAGKDLPASTMKELEALGKQGANPLTFGSGGTGTVAHLAGEFFGQRSGAKVQHVPYRGEAPALTDAIGGRITVMFSTLASASGHIEGDTMKALAVTTKERAGLLPNVPSDMVGAAAALQPLTDSSGIVGVHLGIEDEASATTHPLHETWTGAAVVSASDRRRFVLLVEGSSADKVADVARPATSMLR